MSFKKTFYFIFILFISFSGISQGSFNILKNNESVTIPFTLVNNLVVISAKVNGKELSFLLDTGIDKTILFNLKFSDSLILKNVEKIKLRGLGEGEPIEALKSKNNLLRINKIVNPNHLIFMIIDDQFDLSTKMGIDINGIIGGDLFKSFIVKINYSTKKITFYDPKFFTYKKCNNCITLPLEFFNQKPYIDVFVQDYLGEEFKVKLLIDSGGGDALWLFENTDPKITIPEKFFKDYLGRGLSGSIYGKRSKIKKLRIGDYIFENALVSYPDSTSIITVHNSKFRNGTLGAEILKRFHVIFDYQNSKITLKKNLFYKTPFLYNKSGMELVYSGDVLVQEKSSRFVNYKFEENKSSLITEVMAIYNLAYKPSYQISFIRKQSPAHFAGLLVGDVILEINGKPAYNNKLQEIVFILSGKENKKIKLLIERNGKQLKYEFLLKNIL
ncbi:MAG: aspartyl protease family protein [Flavobacteriaceae bacterium]|nr:aspartyl protease family protein [Flavobacteriaceae bacterium]